ncbi:MAG: hypothetical protein KKE00_02600 [Proteobacteria bacterium]|nr:hypothetical protein [Pseudomonadota bacterium]
MDACFGPLFRSGLMQLIRQILLILSDKFLRIMFGFWLLSTTILFLFGAILETCQLLTAYRYFNFKDIMANGLGIGLFLLCQPFMSRLVK